VPQIHALNAVMIERSGRLNRARLPQGDASSGPIASDHGGGRE
jgi:hypothetical protein